MAIPKFKKEYVIEALKFIDENGVPFHNQSTKYELVTDDDLSIVSDRARDRLAEALTELQGKVSEMLTALKEE